MSSNESSVISLDEVNQALEDIERKYSPIKCNEQSDIEEELLILSKDLDTIGLPLIIVSQPQDLILKKVITSARSLVHLYRKTLGKLTDADLNDQSQRRRIVELYKIIEEYKSKLNRNENKGSNLENKLMVLQNENACLGKRETVLKEEMDKLKRYHTMKQNEMLNQYKKIVKEYHHLKKIYEKDSTNSKNDVLMQLLDKYRKNEDIYKSTIQKLQENNQKLVEELLSQKDKKCLTKTLKQ